METNIIFLVIVGVAMLADVVTGLLQAVKNKTFQSAKMRVGLWHKVSFILIMAFAYGVEYAEGLVHLGVTVPLFIPVVAYIILNECTSILENIALINPELKNSKVFRLFDFKKDDEDDA